MKNFTFKNRTRMIVILMTVGLWTFASCKKHGPDTSGPLVAKLEIVSGDGQSGYYDELLAEPVVVKLISSNPLRRYYVSDSDDGKGLFSISSDDHTRNFEWRLSNYPGKPEKKIYLYEVIIIPANGDIKEAYSDPYLTDEITFFANPVKPKGWVRAYVDDPLLYDFKGARVHSFDDKTLYVAHPLKGMYSSNDGGMTWSVPEKIPEQDNIADIRFNNKGWMYLQTKEHGIFYSREHEYWQNISIGISDYRQPVSFWVDDEILMTGFYFSGLHLSSDNGASWRQITVDPQEGGRYYNLARTGNMLYLFDGEGHFRKSGDLGESWETIDLGLSNPEELRIGPDGLLYIGTNNNKLAVISPETFTGDVHDYYESGGNSDQYVNRISFVGDDVYYMVNNSSNAGLYRKSNDWGKVELDFDQPVLNYLAKKDGTLLLISENGIYYYNE
jgi:hypothetical protein